MDVREKKFFDLLDELKFKVERRKFNWLTNKIIPSEEELWRIFSILGGEAEAMQSKGSRRLTPDGYLPKFNCIIEFDELQHFTEFRLQTLLHYPADMYLGFDIESYRSWCDEYSIKALKKGPSGYRKPRPEFPFEGGRAAQRALFDTFRDLLPSRHGLNPTIRISEFQLPSLLSDKEKAVAELSTALSRIKLGSCFRKYFYESNAN